MGGANPAHTSDRLTKPEAHMDNNERSSLSIVITRNIKDMSRNKTPSPTLSKSSNHPLWKSDDKENIRPDIIPVERSPYYSSGTPTSAPTGWLEELPQTMTCGLCRGSIRGAGAFRGWSCSLADSEIS